MVQIDSKHKCETCAKANLKISSIQVLKETQKPFDLILSDIYDLNMIKQEELISILLLLFMIVQN